MTQGTSDEVMMQGTSDEVMVQAGDLGWGIGAKYTQTDKQVNIHDNWNIFELVTDNEIVLYYFSSNLSH